MLLIGGLCKTEHDNFITHVRVSSKSHLKDCNLSDIDKQKNGSRNGENNPTSQGGRLGNGASW